MKAAISKKAKQSLPRLPGAAVYHSSSGSSNLIEPNDTGITNNTGKAELAAITAAVTCEHIHVATHSLSSLHQIRKQLLYPEKQCHHVQDILIILLILSVTLNPTSAFTK